MPVYKCTITTPEGHAFTKTMVADSMASIKSRVAQDGHFLVEVRRSAGDRSFFSLSRAKPLKTRDFISFNQELSVLLKSGMPVVGALDLIIAKENNKGFQSLLKEIRTDISHGEPISSAFSKHEHLFSSTYSAALKAGESNANIPGTIAKYVDALKRSEKIRQKVKAAAVYPLILCVASVFVVGFLMTYVVPSIAVTFTESGADLPTMTKMLLATSHFFRNNLLWIALGCLSIFISGKVILNMDAGKKVIHKMVLKLPILGAIVRAYAVSRFTSTLSTQLSSGFTLNKAMETASDLIGNRAIRDGLSRALGEVEKGESFSDCLKKSEVFPDLAVGMIIAGEQSASLEEILMDLSELYEEDVENSLVSLTAMIEPLLMLLMGGLIGFIVLALYMPIFQMAGTI